MRQQLMQEDCRAKAVYGRKIGPEKAVFHSTPESQFEDLASGEMCSVAKTKAIRVNEATSG
jgi:hypothetical protein